jgi:hypothetical protein
VGVARLVADGGADCDVEPWDPEPDPALGEWGVSTLGVGRTALGSGGVDGVVTRGVVSDGVLTGGVLTGPTDTGGVVTEGTVTAGTLTLGTETVGTLTVGTLTAGTLTAGTPIVGTDAEAAAGTSSAPQAMRTAIACRRMGGRTSPRSPPDRSATKGLEIANRLRTGLLFIGPRARDLRVPHDPPRAPWSPGQFTLRTTKLCNGALRTNGETRT